MATFSSRSRASRAIAGLPLRRALVGGTIAAALTATAGITAGIPSFAPTANAQEQEQGPATNEDPTNVEGVEDDTDADDADNEAEVDTDETNDAEADADVNEDAEAESGDPAPAPDEIINADAIANGSITHAKDLAAAAEHKHTLHGWAFSTPNDSLVAIPNELRKKGTPVPDGTTIYAQYREKDGTLSPVYSAKTHTLEGGINGGEGVYVFEFPTYVDEDGNEHDFGYVGQQVRVWAENYTDENGVRHVATAGAPGNVPGEFGRVAIGSNGSLHNPAAHSVTNTYVGFVSQPNANFGGDPDDVIVDERGPLGKDANTNSDAVNDHSISGNVFFNTEESGGDIINIANGDGAEPLEGYTVKVATLTDEGARANEELKASNDPSEWPRLTQELIASNPEYVSAVVSAQTDENGDYTVRFPQNLQFNSEHLYAWVEDPSGSVVPTVSAFQQPYFTNPLEASTAVTPRITGASTPKKAAHLDDSLINIHFAVLPVDDIRDFSFVDADDEDNPAEIGDEVELNLDAALVPGGDYKVEISRNGDEPFEVLEGDDVHHGDIATVTVPEDAEDGDTFTATLFRDGQPVGKTSFTVSVPEDEDEDDQPGDGEGQPGEGDGLPGDDDGLPGDDEGEGDGLPGDDEGQPGEDDGQPGEDDGLPGEGDSLPGDDEGLPGEGDSLPGDDEGLPGEGDSLPGDDEGEGDGQPGEDEDQGDEAGQVPGAQAPAPSAPAEQAPAQGGQQQGSGLANTGVSGVLTGLGLGLAALALGGVALFAARRNDR